MSQNSFYFDQSDPCIPNFLQPFNPFNERPIPTPSYSTYQQSDLFKVLIDQHYTTQPTFLEEPLQPLAAVPPPTRKEKKKKKSDTEKNIVAYVTKKVAQMIVERAYRRKVEKLCFRNGCHYEEIKRYFEASLKKGFGITNLGFLITPQQDDEVGMLRIKAVFRSFFKWFLRQKYMFYMLEQGKMGQKDIYIEYKNKYLLYIDEHTWQVPEKQGENTLKTQQIFKLNI